MNLHDIAPAAITHQYGAEVVSYEEAITNEFVEGLLLDGAERTRQLLLGRWATEPTFYHRNPCDDIFCHLTTDHYHAHHSWRGSITFNPT